jgi:hypothetical protein
MLAYRRKTKTDETVSPSEFYRGRLVFVDGPNGREERVCVGPGYSPVTMEEYRRIKRGTPQRKWRTLPTTSPDPTLVPGPSAPPPNLSADVIRNNHGSAGYFVKRAGL